MFWRFSANHTHLYPGALLRSLDNETEAHLSPNDELLVEFSDGISIVGQLLNVDSQAAILQMPLYRTQHGTEVTARIWRLVPAGEPGSIRVQRRLSSP